MTYSRILDAMPLNLRARIIFLLSMRRWDPSISLQRNYLSHSTLTGGVYEIIDAGIALILINSQLSI